MTKITRRSVSLGALSAATLLRTTSSRAQQQPKRGGTFTAVFINEPASMDPVLGNNPGNDGRSYNLFAEKLLYQDFDGNYKPMLADAWQFSEDGLTLTFKLRQGIKFQDGTPFDAAAVKHNLDRARDPSPRSRTAPYLTALTAVDVVDAST